MIILDEIYSENGLFDKVKFHSGVNLIIGQYFKRGPGKELEGNVNGVGKSTLVRLIDFTLLAESVAREHFDIKRHQFLKEHSVTLRFHSKNRNYEIKRYFDDPRKPYFGENSDELTQYDIEVLRRILGGIFFKPPVQSDDFDPKWFRDLMHFFVKDDIDSHERLDPLNFVDRSKRKFQYYSYNELLMGLPFNSTLKFDKLSEEKKSLNTQKNDLKVSLEESGTSIEKINSELFRLESKIRNLESGVKQFKFFTTYEQVNKELLEISDQINELVRKYREATKRLDEYKKSYDLKKEIDEEKVVRLYKELNESLSNYVKRTLNEVLEFRIELAKNRSRFVKEREIEVTNEISNVSTIIKEKENTRSRLYNILDSKGELNDITATYEQLLRERTRQEHLYDQISSIEKIETKLGETGTKIAETINEINEDISSNAEKTRDLISLFDEIISHTIPEASNESVFNIRPRTNVTSPLVVTLNIPKEEALGNTRFKIVAYDLTLFLNMVINRYDYPNFLIHDGVFHGVGLKTIIRTLNHVEEKSRVYQSLQYIVTANEGELIQTPEERQKYGDYNFDLQSKIIAQYNDSEKGMIFKGVK